MPIPVPSCSSPPIRSFLLGRITTIISSNSTGVFTVVVVFKDIKEIRTQLGTTVFHVILILGRGDREVY